MTTKQHSSPEVLAHRFPLGLVASTLFSTKEEAEAFRALFPSSLKLKVTKSWDSPQSCVVLSVNLTPQEGNPSNEAGLKRFERFLKLAQEQGAQVVEVEG